MFTISFVSQKGGTGKSTILTGTAVEAARRGYDVAIIDVDPQASSARWKDRREAENPAVVSAQASRLKQTIEAARGSEVDFVFIDTQGRLDDAALAAVRAADLVISPIKPSIIELETLPQVKDMVTLARKFDQTFVLINGVHSSAGLKSVQELQNSLAKHYEVNICPPFMARLDIHENASNEGKTPQEVDLEGRASTDLARLFDFIQHFVQGTTQHGLEDVRASKRA